MPTDLATMIWSPPCARRLRSETDFTTRSERRPFHGESLKEKDVDILRFPTPRYNIDDGGRYIGTGHLTSPGIRKKVGLTSALTE